MGMCKGCNEVYSSLIMKNGFCPDCFSNDDTWTKSQINREENQKKLNETSSKEYLKTVMVTTESILTDKDGSNMITKRIGIVTSERVYGLNFVKDFFTSIRNFVGGRVDSIEKPLHTGKIEAIKELQKEAYLLGANAIVGLSIEHSSYSVLSISATGTAVVIDDLNSN